MKCPDRLSASAMERCFILLSALALAYACGATTEPSDGGDGSENPSDPVNAVEVSVKTAERAPISPYIYGSNQDDGTDVWTVRRYGGNRTTGYNWENNFSNAGSDYFHQSDSYAITSAHIPMGEMAVPARALTWFHDQSLAMGAESVVTLQMAGYVARDGNGPVAASETAPSARWVKVESRKGSAFTTTPDLNDGVVYMDELVSLIVKRYGIAASPSGVRWYSMDNEPALWSSTHPRIHPDPVGARELVDRSIALATAVKAVDPTSEIIGPALYGMAAYVTLQDAPDWNTVRQGNDWFIDYYLDQMKAAEQSAGRRLLDVLDVHWYPEARGDHRIVDASATTQRDAAARIQAPRSLWDATYKEDSWIEQVLPQYLPILPRLQTAIDQHYPGTHLSVSEYDYGGGDVISGGLAQADVLGIFGRSGVYLATQWGISEDDSYTSAAFKLYRDYDGARSTFGNTSVSTVSTDPARISAYGSIQGSDESILHLVLLNKDSGKTLDFHIRIESGTSYTAGRAWGFDANDPRLTERLGVTDIAGNAFEYTVPPLTAIHLVLR